MARRLLGALCALALAACASLPGPLEVPAARLPEGSERRAEAKAPDASFLDERPADERTARATEHALRVEPWSPALDRRAPDPTSAERLWLVPADRTEGISPYHGERFHALERVLVRTADGRLWFTAPLGTPGPDWLRAAYLDPRALRFSSAHGQLTPGGDFDAAKLDPTRVATTGYVVTVSVPGGAASASHAYLPSFARAPEVDAGGAAGAPGAQGAPGQDGARGRTGQGGFDAQPGADGSEPAGRGARGGDATPGSRGADGASGEPGGAGSPGQRGQDAPEVQVVAEPLESPLFERPLVKLSVTRAGTTDVVVLHWGQAYQVVARGGQGGAGGRGGRGGHGGAGGQGGGGGDGGRGGRGGRGTPGRDGAPGAAGTRQGGGDGQDGQDGSQGGRGGDGGDGGIGGRGGDGGTGGDAARGGDGAPGGDGGHGATVRVRIDGPPDFVAMARRCLSFDVSGGAGGAGGAGGDSGAAGAPGAPGRGGDAGAGGQGGPGGRGGAGGPGGQPATWVEDVGGQYVNGLYVPKNEARTGRTGDAGERGAEGEPGLAGTPGASGADGDEGRPGRRAGSGKDARAGAPGRAGKVLLSE